ncbi:MAG: hypothetical protein ACI9OJ_003173 [Myxococcota bacterium]|jgi:hypothetical protein
MRTSHLIAFVLVSSFVIACGAETEETTAQSSPDALADVMIGDTFTAEDANETPDEGAGETSKDATFDPPDTGLPPKDTTEVSEITAPTDTELGVDTERGADIEFGSDAEPADVEAPMDISDASLPQDISTDVAPDVAADGGEPDTGQGPMGDNVLTDGSFETWADGLPVGWSGTATNLSTDSINEESLAAHDGVLSCRLNNASDGHKRFSTAPLSLESGKYDCRYWVRGQGEIRNARYNDGYSSYSGYTTVSAEDWVAVDYDFNVAEDTAAFELVFSVRNTSESGLLLDDVTCVRLPGLCDDVTCESYQVCKKNTGECVTAPGKCADNAECASWEECTAEHECTLAPGACTKTADCTGDTPVCDAENHQCVAGDPCADVACLDWQVCEPSDASCIPAGGKCTGLEHCGPALPVCDLDTHSCVAIDAPANVVPNGGFEHWESVSLGGAAEYLLPVSWYGICDGCSPDYPSTEIAPSEVVEYTTAPHQGAKALQLVQPSVPADRFVSEPFTVTPGVTYQCAYQVRGKGTFRQRGYCGGWNTDTEFTTLDSDTWTPVTFELGGATSWCVILFYASNTEAASDHIQFDDVVCIAP